MHQMSRLMLAVGLVGLASAGQVAAQGSDFAAELLAAQKAADSEPLKSYLAGPFSRTFGKHYIEWVNECSQKAQQNAGRFDMLITIGAKGVVDQVRYEPRTPVTECFAGLVKAEVFAPPPKPGLVVPATMLDPKK